MEARKAWVRGKYESVWLGGGTTYEANIAIVISYVVSMARVITSMFVVVGAVAVWDAGESN